MALVEGAYCPVVEQVCLEWQESFGEGGRKVKNQCARFAAPTRCLTPSRAPMRFCMDRYEWPNEKGALPRVLVSWRDAAALCASHGKRLCTEPEFNLACEGDELLPFVYGYERDPSKCNLDRPYRPRTTVLAPWEECQSRPGCRAAFEALDQRVPAGSMEGCQSRQGIFDLNGNVNEWVELPGKGVSHRAGLKGGWWGPVRNRCRPTVTFHGESDFGYEAGFRCCDDAGAG
jgi:formylglycine-generating enzyme required for sulfatase activity